MIPLPFERRAIGLPQDGGDFLAIEILYCRSHGFFHRDAKNRGTLCCGQRLPISHEAVKRADGRQAAVASADCVVAFGLDVLVEREHLINGQVAKRECADGSSRVAT